MPTTSELQTQIERLTKVVAAALHLNAEEMIDYVKSNTKPHGKAGNLVPPSKE